MQIVKNPFGIADEIPAGTIFVYDDKAARLPEDGKNRQLEFYRSAAMDNPFYNFYFLFAVCSDTAQTYPQLFDAIRQPDSDFLPLFDWEQWPAICIKVRQGLLSRWDFVLILQAREQCLVRDVMKDD
jgi:hypothetical protein